VDGTANPPVAVCLDCPLEVPPELLRPRYMNVKEAARRMDCSHSQVRRLVRLGRLPAERHGKDIRIPLSAIPAAA
jgi:excisionase family DNA binding protein